MRGSRWWVAVISALLYVFLYAPIAVVMVYSFNAARYGGPWRGFTTKWYGGLLDSPDKLDAAWNTLVLAGVSTLVATLLGTCWDTGCIAIASRAARLSHF